MALEWLISIRLEGGDENRKKVDLLTQHAWLKYGGTEGGMGAKTISEFFRFLVNYYYANELREKGEA